MSETGSPETPRANHADAFLPKGAAPPRLGGSLSRRSHHVDEAAEWEWHDAWALSAQRPRTPIGNRLSRNKTAPRNACFVFMMGLSTFLTASVLALRLFSLPVDAKCAPKPGVQHDVTDAAAGDWWMSGVKHQGAVAYGSQSDYKVFRSVKDYGAKGDGSTDDTAAINSAITDGARCGQGCDSSTVKPAIVYFPPGTYVVSKPIVAYYYTQLIGDFNSVPTLKSTANFEGIAVIDSNPYNSTGGNWFTNQNNFFRQIRNFKIDLTGQPKTTGTGIHWQVAQATSLQNIEFNMIKDSGTDNKQQGIFMENGSGGFMTDLIFNGGALGAFFGNQQFTTRNLQFNNCNTAVKMQWNWAWTFHGISIKDCGVGIDMSQTDNGAQTVGSILLLDSTIANTPVGIVTAYNPEQQGSNGTLILDNVDMTSNVPVAVKNVGTNQTILEGNSLIASWVQGRSYKGTTGSAGQGTRTPVAKPAALTDGSGKIVAKSKPQYGDVPASKFISAKDKGCKGDGKTDDTAAFQAMLDNIGPDEIIYVPHGAYVFTDTVKFPASFRMVGECFTLFMAGGDSAFKDQANPKPVLQIGQPGDVGTVEMQDIMIETLGPQPGAILMEFNVAGQSKGAAGLWDVHFRVGGSAGTQLQSDKCTKTPDATTSPNPECFGAFMLLHITQSASPYLENVWAWVSDHELDLADHNQINIYNGRGILIESTKGAWLWGTSSEHSVLSNYQLNKAQNVYMALIQTETAYFQGNPDANVPFTVNAKYSDPDFSRCTSKICARTWGLRIQDSKDVLVYGGGLYSFYDNYDQTCVPANNCQENMVAVDNSSVELFGITTKASVAVITLNGGAAAKDVDNRSTFGACVAVFEAS
ncbi:40S ribosomal protein S7 [Purpureocillium lavendulum]|uniref:40S ribosomal protein S7 n=1 Tax=Purpureocillium lavendulum TaxID=1247861 RepID=A0AB34G573_9HYPO|nr:40S ribosomal protein S7 [Purpureocillium lavendulum]